MTASIRRLAALALITAGGVIAPAAADAQKALVYCPSADATGCAAIGTALSAHPSFPGGADRGFDGSSGTVDLGSADLSEYAVFIVPSLATDGSDPYAVLRSEPVASRIRGAFTGRVAVWSGTPDLGTGNLDKKQALIRNLARWAAADVSAGRAGGIVALQDASPEALARYGWLAQISSVSMASDAAVTEVYANVEARTAAGREILDWNGLQLGYTNMASGALIVPAGASVEATGGRTTGAVLVTFAGESGGEPIATVTTDKQDYQPGETVTITGTGWLPGETVSMQLHEEPLVHGDRTLSAVADADGKIFNNSFKPEEHDFGVRFVLTAVGGTSGRTAQTTFTDGNRTTFSLTAAGAAVATFGTVNSNQCVAAFTQARQGNNLDSETGTVALSSSPAGAVFFTTSNCTGATTSSLVFSNAQSRAFSFRIVAAGLHTITGDAPWSNSSNDATATVTVAAAAPTVDAAGPYSGNEGSPVALSGATASGGAAPLTYQWTYVAGAGVDAGTTCSFSPDDTSLNPSVTCTDDGSFTLTLTVAGSNGQSASDNATLTLTNVAPTANAGGPYSGNEGSSIPLTGNGDDAGNNDDAGLTYVWTVTTTGIDAGGSCTIASPTSKNTTVTCTDNGSFTVSLVSRDDENASSVASTANLTVANVAPIANAGPDYTGNEGSPVQLNGSATDASANDTRTWSWQYLNGPSVDAGATCTFSSATAEDPTVTCTDDGVVELTLTVTDDDGGSTNDKANLTLANVPPTANAGGPYSGNEGAAIQLSGAGDDTGNNDDAALTYRWTADVTGIASGGACTFDDDTRKDAKVTCTDNGVFKVVLVVKDDDNGTSAPSEATLTVNNVAPVADAGGPYSGNEGAAISLNGSTTDAGSNDTHTWSWQYLAGPGVDAGATCSFSSPTAEDPTITCTDDGTVQLTFKARDDDGAEGSDVATLTVSNVAPVAEAGGPYAGDEGSAIQLDGSATDAGTNDQLTYLWSAATSGIDANGACTFDDASKKDAKVTCTDDGTFSLTLTVKDDDGGEDTDTATLTVANVDPVADAGPATYTGTEGTAVSLNGSVTDAGANDTHTWSWQYIAGAGALDPGASCSFDNASAEDPRITCTDDGTVELTLTVTDDDGGSDSDTAILTIANAPPVAVAGGPYSGTEGGAITLDGSATDPGSNDQLSYLWSVATPGIDADGVCTFDDATKKDAKITCTDDGSFTLTLQATDDDGGTDSETATLAVANAIPVANAGGPYSGQEGASIALSGTATDAGSNDALTTMWSYSGSGGTCAITNGTSLNASITCFDNGTYQVTLTVTDDDLATHSNSATLTVSNVAPILSAITAPLDPVNINTAVAVSANFTDQGTGDTHTGLINWGDGTTAALITETNGSGTATGTHAYTSPGVYTIRMTVRDDDGAVSNESVYQYVVVFDPSAGFVTGGGWLNSTPGMYRVDLAAQGKANFGFVSKYQKGAIVPTGNTEFQFHAGDLNFKSSVYQWLVVQGQTKASYKGSGTINGSGDYGFMLSVIDGGNSGDKFRIKIWNKSANDLVVYDNLLADAGDDALPTTGIMGGNIVVHAK